MKKITIDGEVYVLEKDVLRNTGDFNTGHFNTGHRNTGNRNTGNRNAGNWNTGDWNTGDGNTGNWNTGNWNTGNGNTGNWNTGNWNTGNWNTGNWNTGNGNTGDGNTGDGNTGDGNTGIRNTGSRNTGSRNTGNWNTGNWNTGFLNTNESTVRMFNKDTGLYRDNIDFPNYFYFDVPTTSWIDEEDMTDEEKENNPTYKTTGGYLKKCETDKSLKTYWKEAFDNAPIEEIEETLKLPNFDYDIFEEITGISKEDFNRRLGGDVIEIDGVKYQRVD